MTLKLRKKSLFPALVSVSSPITLVKSGAAYTFGFDSTAYTAGVLPEFVAAVAGSLPIDVKTIAALRTATTGVAFAASVRGYYADNDGGGGLFYWNASSTATDNGGSIIAPSGGGTGRWIRSAPSSVYTPKMFGAKGDGTNDKAFVQAAIDAINSAGGGILWFDVVYTVGGTLHANGFSIIDLKSGVNFDGPGGLKLAANTNVANSVFSATFAGTTMTVTAMTSGAIIANQFISGSGLQPVTQVVTQLSGTPNGVGTYQTTTTNALGATACKGINRMVELVGAYNTTSNAINDTTYQNIILDYNGANNCASGSIWSFNSVVSVQTCDGVVFDNVRFRNNCGSNSIVLGTYQTTLTAFRCRISNCSFENDGDRINAASADYSTIFAVGSHIDIVGNTFGIGPTLGGAAWEVYGSDININGNTVSGYYAAANVVAIANQTTQNVNITGNSVQDCSCGITLWTLATTSKLRSINISDNTFVANVAVPGGPYMVDGVATVTTNSELRNILISNNVWQNTDLSDTARTSAGISLAAVVTAEITGNLINGIPGPGIYIERSIDPASITITGNTLLNTGYTATAASKTGITLAASGTTGSLLIQGNLIQPFAGYTLTTGIKNALAVSSGLIQNNLILSATTPINNTGAGVVSITQPTASGTFATLANAETLTNKTIAGASNTLSVRIANDVTGLGTGVAAFLATPSSANFAAAVTDEDGTGVVPFEATGTWTPTDQSGAALTFTSVNCKYTRIGNIVHAYGTLTYPATGSGSTALIGGLPFTVPNASYAIAPAPVKNSVGIAGTLAIPVINTANFNIWNNGSATNQTNANLTGAVLNFNISYPVT